MENLEMKSFEIIANVGSARSFFIEAIQHAKNGDFDKADESMKSGAESFTLGHHAHSSLIQMEASGDAVPFSLILMHAEDQLMSAEGFKIIATEFIDLYKTLKK